MKSAHPEEAPAQGELCALVSGASIELKALLGRLENSGVRLEPLGAETIADLGSLTPGVVLCDLASEGALGATASYFARNTDGSVPQLVTLGTPRGSISETESALLGRARLRFRRPLDVQAIALEVIVLLREPRPSTRAPQSQGELTLSPLKRRPSQLPRLSAPRIEALSSAQPSSLPSPPGPEELVPVPSRQLGSPGGAEHSVVSPELETLLAEAERRVQAQISTQGDTSNSNAPEAGDARLSDDVWDALGEPLDEDGESPLPDASSDPVPPSPLVLDVAEPNSPPPGESTAPPGRWQDPLNDDTGSFAPIPESEQAPESEATSGSMHPATAAGKSAGPITVGPVGRHDSTEDHEELMAAPEAARPRPPSTTPPGARKRNTDDRPATIAPTRLAMSAAPPVQPVTIPSLPPAPAQTGTRPSSAGSLGTSSRSTAEPELDPSEETHGTLSPEAEREESVRAARSERSAPASAPRLDLPGALVRGGAPMVIGRAVRQRFTGCLAFEVDQGLRRIVFKDGDVVIAASAVHGESLVAFLAQRGDLSAETASQIEHRIPAFGRHAGAALIARVLLQQNELWPVLRAHSEWVLAQICLIERGTVQIEHPVPERLGAEPAVFGGATGAEVLVEVIERAIPPPRALEHLGSEAGKFAAGAASSLLGECALSAELGALVVRAREVPLGELLTQSPDPPILPCVLYALCLLEVLRKVEIEPVVAAPTPRLRAAAVPDRLDDEAVRARVLARRALVDEGDYFALLGVPRQATGYDIRRSYTELRRQFEPGQVLRASTLDLAEDVDTILEVLDEAYEILRDQQRRERYRRAIESTP